MQMRARIERLESAIGSGGGMLAVVAVGDVYSDAEINTVLPADFSHGNPGNLIIRVRKRLDRSDERSSLTLPELHYAKSNN